MKIRKVFGFALGVLVVSATVYSMTPATNSLAKVKDNNIYYAASAVNASTSSTTTSNAGYNLLTQSAGSEITVQGPAGVTLKQFASADSSGGAVACTPDVIPSGTKVYTASVATTDQTYSVATALMSHWRPKASVVAVYNCSAQTAQGTWLSAVDGKIAISVPTPVGLTVPSGKTLKVYRYLADGTIQACETVIDGNRVVWASESFATFAFVAE